MRALGILIIGSRESRSLVKKLRDCGFASQIESTIQAALRSLQLQRFVAIVVDYPHAQVDIVELVLNVRDVNADIPIMILGSRPQSEDQLGTLPLPVATSPAKFPSVDALIEELAQSAQRMK